MLMSMFRNTAHLALAGAVAMMATSLPAWSQESNQQRAETQAEVVGSQATLTNLMRDPDAKWFQDNIGSAKGVLLSSEVLVKARVLKAGAGGRSVLLVKGADGKWRGPVFASITLEPSAFKEGVKASEVAALVMTDKGIAALTGPGAKLGGDVSYAAGPVGAGAAGPVTADVVGYTRVKGAYGGVNLDGASVKPYADWNAAYYNAPGVQVKDILSGKATSRDTVSLLNAVNKASGGGAKK